MLFKSERAGAVDLSMDAKNPRVLYAAVWQAQRYPWGMTSGGAGLGALDVDRRRRHLDRHHAAIPGCRAACSGGSASPSRPPTAGRVWALVEAEDGALFRSDDGGDTWQRGSEEPGLRGRPWYYMHVFADPSDADTVWVADYSLWKSHRRRQDLRARWPPRTATTTTSGSTPPTRGA